jgi:CheY-like chemotaxis protein
VFVLATLSNTRVHSIEKMIPSQRARILCVDDNAIILENIGTFLTQNGYRVDTARNGQSALMKVSSSPYAFQLIITDLRMPGLDGFELITEVRAAGYIGPIIVYSGQMMPGDRQRLGALRVNHVLEKPTRNVEILGIVQQALSE